MEMIFSGMVGANTVRVWSTGVEMEFLVRINGNKRPMRDFIAMLEREAFLDARGGVVGMPG